MHDSLGPEWHWHRCKYQARGSTHTHGCVKLINDPGLYTLIQKAAWTIVEEHTTTTTTAFSREMLSKIHEGEEAKYYVLKYANRLVSTWSDAVPDDSWSIPDPHPCAISVANVALHDMDNDYRDLVNNVERHTQCRSAYCLTKKRGQQNLQCRFDFPKPTQANSNITFERSHDRSCNIDYT